MADEDRPFETERRADLYDIVGVAREMGIFVAVVGREVRPAGTDMIEQDNAKLVLEVAGDVAPHILVAAETVREHYRALTGPEDLHIISLDYHPSALPQECRPAYSLRQRQMPDARWSARHTQTTSPTEAGDAVERLG
jgi:hypothetical protein